MSLHLLKSFGIGLCALLIACSRPDNFDNPLMQQYQGDYRLSIDWNGLPDTLEIFRPYRIAWRSTGADTFAAIMVLAPRSGAIDTALIASGPDSTITLYFTDTLRGPLILRGARPNSRSVDSLHQVIVVNPYAITCDSLVGVGDTVRLLVRNSRTTASQVLAAIWSIDGIARDTLGLDMTLPCSRFTSTSALVGAILADNRGHQAPVPTRHLTFRGYRPILDSVAIGPTIALADSFSLRLFISDADATPLWAFVSDSVGRIDTTAMRGFASPLDIRVKMLSFDTGAVRYTVSVRDTTGLATRSIQRTARVSHTIPTVAFSGDTIFCDRNDSATVGVGVISGSAHLFYWRFGDGFTDTTTIARVKRVFDSAFTPATVWAVDRFGYRSPPDSVVIAANPFAYKLRWVQNPDLPAARHLQTWSTAIDSADRFSQRGGKYFWRVHTAQTLVKDTSGVDLTALSVMFADSINARLTVWAADTAGGSSAPLETQCVVSINRPWCFFAKESDTIRIGKDLTVVLRARDTVNKGRIDSIYWDKANDGSIEISGTAKDSALTLRYDVPGIYLLSAWAVDDDGYASAKDTLTVVVRADRPYFTQTHVDTMVYMKAMATLRAKAHAGESGVPVVRWYWLIAGHNPRIDSSTVDSIRHLFAAPGADTVIVRCRDADGLMSVSADTFVVTVSRGRPTVLPGFTDSVFIHDTRQYTVRGADPNGSIVLRGVSWESGQAFEMRPDSIFSHAYATAGLKVVRMFAVDTDANSSDTLTDSVFVKLAKPAATPLFSDSVWIRDTVAYKLRGIDPNGGIISWAICWQAGQPFEIRSDSVFKHTYAIAGVYMVSAYVVDDDSISSDTVVKSVHVKLGKPVVLSITPDSSIFINDARQFSIVTFDSNGTVDSIAIDNGSGSFGGFVKTINGAVTINRRFSRAEAGSRIIKAIAKDNDGVLSDTAKSAATVQLGAPVVDSIKIANVTGNNFFVKDNNAFRIYVTDPNGTLKKIYAAWNNGSTPDDSVTVNISKSGYGEISHSYDTTMSGNRTVKFWAADDDTIMSVSSKDTTILERLGAPVIWGDGLTKDTVWVIIDSGVGRNYPIRIQHYDTNGTMANYFWNEAGPSLGRSTTTDTIQRNFGANEVNSGFSYWIYGRDDDGFTRGGKFVVYADSAPPKPETYPDPAVDSVTIYWKGKDAKEGNQTEYLILLRENADPDTLNSADIISNWRIGYSISDDNTYDFMYRFKMVDNVPNKMFRYRVLARDKRLSISRSDIANFPY
jgi:hypothetical protein